MKIKIEYIILGAFVIALSAYLAFRSSDRTRYELPELKPFSGAEVTKIEIVKRENAVTLAREGDTWQAKPQGYPADGDKVKGMLETLEKLALTAMVSESKSYDRYDLGEDRKITVKAWAGDTVRIEFDIGKAAPSFQHTFVRIAGDPRVYHARDNFRGKFDQTLDNLRDKNVLKFEKSDIQEVELTKDGEKIVLLRKDVPVEVKPEEDAGKETPPSPPKPETVWETQGGRQAQQEKLDRLLTSLANLRCESYLEEKKKEDMLAPTNTIRVTGAQEHRLSIFAKTEKDDKGYPAVSSQNDYVFLLPAWQAERIMLGPADLIKTEARKEDSKAPGNKNGTKGRETKDK